MSKLFNDCGGWVEIYSAKQAWKQFLSAAGGPTAYVADQKYGVKMSDISEKLEKAGGKSRPQPKKFVSKPDLRDWIPAFAGMTLGVF